MSDVSILSILCYLLLCTISNFRITLKIPCHAVKFEFAEKNRMSYQLLAFKTCGYSELCTQSMSLANITRFVTIELLGGGDLEYKSKIES